MVQGTAADTVKQLLLRLHAALALMPGDRCSASVQTSAPQASPEPAAAQPRIAAVCRNEIVIEALEEDTEAVLQVGLAATFQPTLLHQPVFFAQTSGLFMHAEA